MIRFEEPLVDWTMISHRPFRWLVLRARIISSGIIDRIEVWSRIVTFLSATEYTPGLDLFFVVLGCSHPSAVRLLACSSCFWYICRISTANFWKNVASWCIWELLWTMACRQMSRVRRLIWVSRHHRLMWMTSNAWRGFLILSSNRQQNVRSIVISFNRIRPIDCKRLQSSNLVWRLKFPEFVCECVCSEDVFWHLKPLHRMVVGLVDLIMWVHYIWTLIFWSWCYSLTHILGKLSPWITFCFHCLNLLLKLGVYRPTSPWFWIRHTLVLLFYSLAPFTIHLLCLKHIKRDVRVVYCFHFDLCNLLSRNWVVSVGIRCVSLSVIILSLPLTPSNVRHFWVIIGWPLVSMGSLYVLGASGLSISVASCVHHSGDPICIATTGPHSCPHDTLFTLYASAFFFIPHCNFCVARHTLNLVNFILFS